MDDAGPNSPSAQRAGRLAAALAGHDPLPADPELEGHDPALGIVGGVVVGRVGRHQPGVVLGRGQHVAHREVARAQPLVPRHPRGREQRLLAGQQHDLVDGHRVLAGEAGEGHGPVPADVAGQPAGERVGEDRAEHLGRDLAGHRRHGLGHRTLVVTDERRVAGGLDGGGAGEFDRRGQDLVGCGRGPGRAGGLGHPAIVPDGPIGATGRPHRFVRHHGAVPASRRPPGARRSSRTSGRRAPRHPDRIDTTPLDVPRPVTRPMPSAADGRPGTPRTPPRPAEADRHAGRRRPLPRAHRGGVRRVRAASRADGAGESGLTHLLWVQRPAHGRRRDDRRLAGRHPLLRRHHRRPAQQRRALPAGDDGPVRPAGARSSAPPWTGCSAAGAGRSRAASSAARSSRW